MLIQKKKKKTDASFQIPDGVGRLENNAMYGCQSLKSISIPASLTNFYYKGNWIIRDSQFAGLSNLERFDVSSDNTAAMTEVIRAVPISAAPMVAPTPRAAVTVCAKVFIALMPAALSQVFMLSFILYPPYKFIVTIQQPNQKKTCNFSDKER